MRGLLRSRWAPAAAVAIVAALAGGAYAVAAGSGTITACVKKHGGALYSARKCARHDKKLSWNKVGPAGPAGPPGAKGDTGSPGRPGADGPGAQTLSYDGSASATPDKTTLGTIAGVTIAADCFQPSAGAAKARLYLKTGDGSITFDDSEVRVENGGAPEELATHVSLAAGSIATLTLADAVTADAGDNDSDLQVDIVALAPVKAHLTFHLTAHTASSPVAQTCHASAQGFPST